MNPERDFDFIKDWIKDALLLEPKVLEVKQDGFMEATHTRIRMKADPDLLESCAFGYIYGLSVLSFADARPRGVSGMHFSEQDEWTPARREEEVGPRYPHTVGRRPAYYLPPELGGQPVERRPLPLHRQRARVARHRRCANFAP